MCLLLLLLKLVNVSSTTGRFSATIDYVAPTPNHTHCCFRDPNVSQCIGPPSLFVCAVQFIVYTCPSYSALSEANDRKWQCAHSPKGGCASPETCTQRLSPYDDTFIGITAVRPGKKLQAIISLPQDTSNMKRYCDIIRYIR